MNTESRFNELMTLVTTARESVKREGYVLSDVQEKATQILAIHFLNPFQSLNSVKKLANLPDVFQ